MQSLDQSSSGVDVQALPSISQENDQLLILTLPIHPHDLLAMFVITKRKTSKH